jgi:hypothetical protein
LKDGIQSASNPSANEMAFAASFNFRPVLLAAPDVKFAGPDGLACITVQVAALLLTDALPPNLGLECDPDKGRPRGFLGSSRLVDEF